MTTGNRIGFHVFVAFFWSLSLSPSAMAAERGPNEMVVTYVAYHAFAPLWEMPPFVSEAGIQTALSISTNPKAGSLSPKEFIDDQIIRELSDTASSSESQASVHHSVLTAPETLYLKGRLCQVM